MLELSRRRVMTAIAALTAEGSFGASAYSQIAHRLPGNIPADPFPLSQVRLRPSIFLDSIETNQRYLLSLDPDRLLHNFRLFADLETKGERYGGWEAKGIAGHSLGHYQSALSLMHAQTGDEACRERALYISRELALVQANHGDGYAGGSFVERDGKMLDAKVIFEEVRRGDIRSTGFDLNGGWVPVYTYHKLLAGALDAHHYCGDPLSLAVALGLADYFGKIIEGLSDEQVQQLLRVEHGGINESYAELYARTGNRRWLALAERLRHRAVLDPLVDGRDELAGKHANTQIPKVIGLARLYEVAPTAEHRHSCAKAALFFWDTVTKDHSYVIGGNSEHEHFGEPRKLSGRLGQQTCEACNSYNMLKLTRHLYAWSGDPRYFDFYERVHLNHIMSQQHPRTGMFSYFTPLAAGYGRVRSTPDNDFWCCVGSGMESHSKHGESIWWRQGERVLVNLYYPSTLDWSEKGVRLEMDTAFPLDSRVRLQVRETRSPLNIALRVPSWCEAPELRVNGRRIHGRSQGGYLRLDNLEPGDAIELTLPMAVARESMPDDDRLLAFLYGPLVLAADLGPTNDPWTGFDPVLVAQSVEDVLRPMKDRTAEFTPAASSRPVALLLRPFFSLHDSRTAVYFRHFTPSEWASAETAYLAKTRERADAEARTIDVIRLGEMQPERDHALEATPNTEAISHLAERGRVIADGFFQFELAVRSGPADLRVVYAGEARNKDFRILVNDKLLARETLSGERKSGHNVVVYPLPEELLKGGRIRVRFEADRHQGAAVYECRTVVRKASLKI